MADYPNLFFLSLGTISVDSSGQDSESAAWYCKRIGCLDMSTVPSATSGAGADAVSKKYFHFNRWLSEVDGTEATARVSAAKEGYTQEELDHPVPRPGEEKKQQSEAVSADSKDHATAGITKGSAATIEREVLAYLADPKAPKKGWKAVDTSGEGAAPLMSVRGMLKRRLPKTLNRDDFVQRCYAESLRSRAPGSFAELDEAIEMIEKKEFKGFIATLPYYYVIAALFGEESFEGEGLIPTGGDNAEKISELKLSTQQLERLGSDSIQAAMLATALAQVRCPDAFAVKEKKKKKKGKTGKKEKRLSKRDSLGSGGDSAGPDGLGDTTDLNETLDLNETAQTDLGDTADLSSTGALPAVDESEDLGDTIDVLAETIETGGASDDEPVISKLSGPPRPTGVYGANLAKCTSMDELGDLLYEYASNQDDSVPGLWNDFGMEAAEGCSWSVVASAVPKLVPLLNEAVAIERTIRQAVTSKLTDRQLLPLLVRIYFFQKLTRLFDFHTLPDDHTMEVTDFELGCQALGIKLSKGQLIGEFDSMESNEDGTVLFDEMVIWIAAKKFPELFEEAMAGQSSFGEVKNEAGNLQIPAVAYSEFQEVERELLTIIADPIALEKIWNEVQDGKHEGNAAPLSEVDACLVEKFPLLNNKGALAEAMHQTTGESINSSSPDWATELHVQDSSFPKLLMHIFYHNKLLYAFDILDINNDNLISKEEFEHGMPKLGLGLTAVEAAREFSEMERGPDGKVKMKSFIPWFLNRACPDDTIANATKRFNERREKKRAHMRVSKRQKSTKAAQEQAKKASHISGKNKKEEVKSTGKVNEAKEGASITNTPAPVTSPKRTALTVDRSAKAFEMLQNPWLNMVQDSEQLSQFWQECDINDGGLVSLGEIDELVRSNYPVLNSIPALALAMVAGLPPEGKTFNEILVHRSELTKPGFAAEFERCLYHIWIDPDIFVKLLYDLLIYNRVTASFNDPPDGAAHTVEFYDVEEALNKIGLQLDSSKMAQAFDEMENNDGGLVPLYEVAEWYSAKHAPKAADMKKASTKFIKFAKKYNAQKAEKNSEREDITRRDNHLAASRAAELEQSKNQQYTGDKVGLLDNLDTMDKERKTIMSEVEGKVHFKRPNFPSLVSFELRNSTLSPASYDSPT